MSTDPEPLHCKHFRGAHHRRCTLGIDPRSMLTGPGMTVPCVYAYHKEFPSNEIAHCDSLEWPSAEELRADEARRAAEKATTDLYLKTMPDPNTFSLYLCRLCVEEAVDWMDAATFRVHCGAVHGATSMRGRRGWTGHVDSSGWYEDSYEWRRESDDVVFAVQLIRRSRKRGR